MNRVISRKEENLKQKSNTSKEENLKQKSKEGNS